MAPVSRAPLRLSLPLLLLLLTALVFGRVLSHEFVSFDDGKFISGNPAFLPPTLDSLARQWRQPHAHLYVPVTMTFWWLIAHVAGVRDGSGALALNPWIFHAFSLAIHLVNVLLVWRVVRSVIGDARAAAIGAAVWAIHPLQTEAVAWASETKDLLAALFSLLTLAALIEAATRKDATSLQRAFWLAAAVVAYAAALLSKPSAITLPVIAAVVLWAMGVRARLWAMVLAVGVVLSIPFILLTRAAQPALEVVPPALWARPLVAADALAFYLAKLCWPAGITVDYGRTPASIFASGAIRWTWLVPAAATLAAFVAARRGHRALAAAWIIFVAGAATNLGMIPFDFQAISTVADHYVYVSLIGAAIAVAWLVAAVPHAQRVAVVLLALLAVLTFRQAGRWADSPTLWRHAIATNPRSSLALGNLGAFLVDQGDPAAAMPYLNSAAAIDANDPFVHLNLTRARLALGDTAGAADSALNLAAAYQRRAEYDAQLTAAVLDRFAAAIAIRGDAASAQRLHDQAGRLRVP